MATAAEIQIKVGADVSSAINGLSKAQFAADKVAEAYSTASEASVKGGFAIAGWAQNFSTAISAVQRDLEKVDLTKLDDEQKQSTSNMLALASGALRVTESVSVAASAFSGMNAVAGPALAGIARIIPSISGSLVALAGPIGIAVGSLTAGAALIVSNWDLVVGELSEADQIAKEINQTYDAQRAKVESLAKVVADSAVGYGVRSKALKSLVDQSSTYFSSLKIEEGNYIAVNKALVAYNKNLSIGLKIKAAEKLIVDKQAKIYELEQKIPKAFDTGDVFLNNLAKSFTKTKTEFRDELKKEKKELDAIYEETYGKPLTGDARKDLYNRRGLINQYKEDHVVKPEKKEKKGEKTDTERIADIYAQLEKDFESNKIKFADGLIPKLKPANLDAYSSAIEKLFNIDPKSNVLEKVIDEYKAYADQNPISIPVAIGVTISDIRNTSLSSLDTLPDRVSDVAQKMNASFSKINFAESFEDKAKAASDAISKELEGIANKINTAASQASSALSVINTLESNGFAQRNQDLDAYYNKQKEHIEKSVSDEGIKNKKLEALEKEVATKRKAIKRDEAAANKRNSIFNALINTAQGVSAALATGNVPLSVLVGALGAAQVAAIAATPLPALQSGALVSGKNTVVVGEYAGADNNPELISPVNKVKKYITEAVQESGGGGGAQQLYSFISGDDIMLVSERGAYRKNRLG